MFRFWKRPSDGPLAQWSPEGACPARPGVLTSLPAGWGGPESRSAWRPSGPSPAGPQAWAGSSGGRRPGCGLGPGPVVRGSQAGPARGSVRDKPFRQGGEGGAAGPQFLGHGDKRGLRSPPPPARGFSVAGRSAPRPGALPLCLSAPPLLPDKWLLAGSWTRSGEAARRGEGVPRGQRALGSPSQGGGGGDVLTSRQRKELDASKVLFTAGLCLLQS